MSADQPIRSAAASARALLLFTVIAVGALAGINLLTEARIAEAVAQEQLRQLQDILPAGSYDNALVTDQLALTLPPSIAANEPTLGWVARLGGEPTAVILPIRSRDGYSGDIDMLVGIHRDGRIAGVRVTQHRETPGLGDAIDIARSPWITQFDERSLDNPTNGWKVRKDGGDFDQLTGATITPRAVVAAIHTALQFHADNANNIYGVTP